MKTKIGIWIDQSKAIIVSINKGKEDIIQIESSINDKYESDFDGDKGSFKGQQHISNERKNEAKNDAKFNIYLREVASNVELANEIYLFGPAGAKNDLHKVLEEYSNRFKYTLNTIETTDSMTLNQVVAKVKAFYDAQK